MGEREEERNGGLDEGRCVFIKEVGFVLYVLKGTTLVGSN